MELINNYRGRRVLLTGSTGFKGIWLASWLEQLGAEVLGMALAPQPEMMTGWPDLSLRFAWEEQDIRDAAEVSRIIRDYQPEIVFHLAAQPLVRLSYREPVETFATNVMGTAHVLEAAKQTKSVRATVVISTDKCYENVEWHWGYRESDPLGGSDPYSASKACTEIVTSAYRRSFARPNKTTGRSDWWIGSGRAGNVIGGGDWAEDRLVPDIIRSVMRNQPVILRRPLAIRPWQHVLEPLAGYLMLGSRLLDGDDQAAQGWNFGPFSHSCLTVRQVADLVVKHYGSGVIVEDVDGAHPKEAGFLRLDSSQAIAELGWVPLLSDEERIAWTVAWYKAWQADSHNAWRQTEQQINDYQSRISQCPSMSARWFGDRMCGGTQIRTAA